MLFCFTCYFNLLIEVGEGWMMMSHFLKFFKKNDISCSFSASISIRCIESP